MAEIKTKKNDGSVSKLLDAIENEQKRKDCYRIMAIMEEMTGSKGALWGPSIIGFGETTYKYKSGREADWFLSGFSPRKQNITLYILSGFKRFDEIRTRLGKHKIGKSCLYIHKLDDIDEGALREMITSSVEYLKTLNEKKNH